jgi:hypothetical protein
VKPGRYFVSRYMTSVFARIHGPKAEFWTLDERGNVWITSDGFWCGPLHYPSAHAQALDARWAPSVNEVMAFVDDPSPHWKTSCIAVALEWTGVAVEEASVLRDMGQRDVCLIGERVVLLGQNGRASLAIPTASTTRTAKAIIASFPDIPLVMQTLHSAPLLLAAPASTTAVQASFS